MLILGFVELDESINMGVQLVGRNVSGLYQSFNFFLNDLILVNLVVSQSVLVSDVDLETLFALLHEG